MKPIKILYIEDDDSQRISFSKTLRNAGFKVTTASSGTKGLQKFNENPTDIILCDLNMPGLDGIRVVKKLKKNNPELICIVTSAHGSIKSAMKAIEQGAYDFITKPLVIEEFNSSIQKALEQREMKKEIQKYASNLEDMVKERTEKLDYANKQLTALNKLSSRLSKFRNEDKLIERIPELLTKSLDFDRSLLLLDIDGRLTLRSFNFLHDSKKMTNTFERFVKNGNFPVNQIIHQCFNGNRTIFKKNIKRFKSWENYSIELSEMPASYVLTPIRVKNIPIGVLAGNLQHHQRELEHQDIVRFETFTNIVGLSIDKIRGYQNLENKVKERTESLHTVNSELKKKARQLEKTSMDLAEGNIQLLAVKEILEEKNEVMQNVLSELSQRKNELQSLLDTSLSGIIMVNTDGKIVAANQVFNEFFDVDTGKFINKNIKEFNKKIGKHFASPKLYDKQVRSFLKAGKNHSINVDRHEMFRDALEVVIPTHRHISLYSSIVEDRNGKIVGRVWSYTDITKEKESDEQVHAIIEVSPLPFIISRFHDGKILYANKPLADLIGYKIEDLVGRATPDFYYVPQDKDKVLAALKRDGFLKNFETQIITYSGEPIWMVFSLVITRIGGESVVVGALYDISKIKSALEKLAKANNELKDAQTRLVQSEKMASLGMLVAGVAHEINNPIGAVRSMHNTSMRAIEKLKSEFSKLVLNDKNVAEEAKRIFKIIDETNEVIEMGTERVGLIVKQLKSFARLDEAELKKANIHEGIQQALMLSQHEMGDRISVVKKFGDIPDIRCYPAKLNQVFLNMIINAIQAIPDKGKLTISSRLIGNRIHIKFADTGKGIPDDNIENIFDPGFTTKGVGVGTGLGLSICYNIIEEHNGEIKVKSKLNKGTTFEIILPTNLKL